MPLDLNPIAWSLLSVLIVSVISLIGIVFIFFSETKISKANYFFVSLAAGSLLGNSFFHLFPEALEVIGNYNETVLILLSGIITFFILEKILEWRHEHYVEHIHPVGYMNIVADGVHNLIDGILITTSFLVSVPIGISTTLAVILHEIPQELGEFGVLLHAGFSKKKALLLNFLSAMAAFIGVGIAVSLNSYIDKFSALTLPFIAGSFIYIAIADLIPSLHKDPQPKKSFIELFGIILGIIFMLIVAE